MVVSACSFHSLGLGCLMRKKSSVFLCLALVTFLPPDVFIIYAAFFLLLAQKKETKKKAVANKTAWRRRDVTIWVLWYCGEGHCEGCLLQRQRGGGLLVCVRGCASEDT
jgi:hypothetical protein